MDRGGRLRFIKVATQIEPRSSPVSQRSPRTGRGSSVRHGAHQARIVPCGSPFVGIRRARARKMTTNWRHTVQARGPTYRAPSGSGGVWRPARPDAAWRQFVLILRALALLMPTDDASQGPSLAWCAARRRNEPRPPRGLDRARAHRGRDLRRDFDKTKPSASVHAPPTPHTTHLTQSTDSTRSGSG